MIWLYGYLQYFAEQYGCQQCYVYCFTRENARNVLALVSAYTRLIQISACGRLLVKWWMRSLIFLGACSVNGHLSS